MDTSTNVEPPEDRTTEGRIRGIVDAHPVASFFALAYGFSWVGWLPGVLGMPEPVRTLSFVAVVFVLASRFGRPFVEEVLAPETLGTFDEFVRDHGTVALFVVFLLPGLPDDAVCLMAGITRAPLVRLLAVSLVGRFPGYLVFNVAGAGLAGARSVETVAIVGL